MAKRERVKVTKEDVGASRIDADEQPRVVEAVASAAGRGGQAKGAVARTVEAAMAQAVLICREKAKTDPKFNDPALIRAAQLKAREIVLAEMQNPTMAGD